MTAIILILKNHKDNEIKFNISALIAKISHSVVGHVLQKK